ncbi:MAG: hypothetical protein K9K75_02885 [Deltaproteobacteria bacterium]|nr:hypothetical protein [Deltaproteobacteria bacterium]
MKNHHAKKIAPHFILCLLTVLFFHHSALHAESENIAKNATHPRVEFSSSENISLDISNMDIKSAIWLIAEISQQNIVYNNEIGGTVSAKLTDVHWRSALKTVAKLVGLVVVEGEGVTSVTTVDRLLKSNEEKRHLEKGLWEAEVAKKEREQGVLAARGKLQQVTIEAKIVEVSDDFARSLGIRWGGSLRGTGQYPSQLVAGTNPPTNRLVSAAYPDGIAFVDASGKSLSMAPVNFPSSLASPTLGFVIGGSNAVLEAQLQALETNSQGRIISSPRITTIDNVKATISQGEEIPYVTPGTSTTPASVNFKQALLKLEVKPSITAEGKIALEVLATNDWPNYSKATALTNYVPPISTSMIESKVVINDGDTLVIGGIHKSSNSTGVSGVPFLQKIPLIGWFFKSEDVSNAHKQLLVFVTPRIVPEEKSVLTKEEERLWKMNAR